MKYLILCVFAGTLACLNVKAQQSTTMQAQILPGHNYTITFRNFIDYTITSDALTSEYMKKAAAMGVTLPFKITEVAMVKAVAKAGQKNTNGEVPVSLKYVKADLKRQISDPMLSSADADYLNELAGDSVEALLQPNGTWKMGAVSDIRIVNYEDLNRQELINIFKLPHGVDKDPEVGRSYTVTQPFTLMRLMEKPIVVERKLTYKLIEVKDGKAIFDILQKVSGSFYNMANEQSRVRGKGSGKMVFDTMNKMPLELSSDLTVNLSMLMNNSFSLEVSYHSISNNIIIVN